MLNFKATPKQWEFMTDPSFVRIMVGAVGSGKSVMCCFELLRLAMLQAPNEKGERKTRALIVRNTADQLTKTTRETFFQWFPPGIWGVWKEQKKEYHIRQPMADGTTLDFRIWFMPLDRDEDIQKALSLEITFLWINEFREVPPKVINGLLLRLNRYPKGPDGAVLQEGDPEEAGITRSCAIFDTNPPDMDSWHHDKMEEPPQHWAVFKQAPPVLNKDEWIAKFGEDPDGEGIQGPNDTRWWVDLTADNAARVGENYFALPLPGLSQDELDVYYRVRYGRSLSGLPVYDKTWNSELHIAKEPFIPLKSTDYPIIIGLDFGRTPAAALMQRNAWGQIVVLDELTSENMGVETFLSTKLRPLLAQTKYLGCTFMVAPDPAGWAKQQIGEISPVDVVKKAGFKVVKPPTNDPERRIMAVERLLTAPTVGGKTAFQVNPECTHLIKGFRYGYRYKLNKAGQQDHKPDKNEFSHCVVGGTLVATPNGDVPIQDLSVGDMVLTSVGPRRVTATMNRLVPETVELRFSSGARVRCTGDHPFITRTGRVRADALQYGDVLFSIGENAWVAPAKTPSRNSLASGSTASRPATIARIQGVPFSGNDTSIERFGKIAMGIFLTAWRCITSTTTRVTTISGTLSYCPSGSTPGITPTNVSPAATRQSSKELWRRKRQQRRGTLLKKEGPGIESTPNAPSQNPLTWKRLLARTVAKSTRSTRAIRNVGSALQRVSQPLVGLLGWTTRHANAPSAEQTLCATSTQRQARVVSLVGKGRLAEPARVYDLTVEGAHEFYANGILVGNCHDAAQYASLVVEGNMLQGSYFGNSQRREIKRVNYAYA